MPDANYGNCDGSTLFAGTVPTTIAADVDRFPAVGRAVNYLEK
jgi:hypothetical protein